jgi:hypothetical protein
MSTNVVTLKSGGQIAGIVPQTIEEVFRLAKCISVSGLAPQGMNTPEQITVAIMTGLEIGLPPMFAIQKIAVINGRPAIWGDAVPALLWSNGFKLREWIEGTDNDRVAHCEVTRPDGTKIERTYSVKQAIKAGLWQVQEKVKRKSKDGGFYEKDNDSPWFRFQERMLPMRARGYASRDGAADALSGLYLAEELQKPPMRDVTPAKQVLEIPDDVPDQEHTPSPVDQTAQMLPDGNMDEPIADADGFLAKLADDIALCDSAEELEEVAAGNVDMIARLPESKRKKAEQMLAEAAE